MMGYLLMVSVTADIVSFSPKLEPVDVPEHLQSMLHVSIPGLYLGIRTHRVQGSTDRKIAASYIRTLTSCSEQKAKLLSRVSTPN